MTDPRAFLQHFRGIPLVREDQMSDTPATLTIGIPIYPGVDPLDVAGPYEVFSNMASEVKDRCAVTLHVLG